MILGGRIIQTVEVLFDDMSNAVMHCTKNDMWTSLASLLSAPQHAKKIPQVVRFEDNTRFVIDTLSNQSLIIPQYITSNVSIVNQIKEPILTTTLANGGFSLPAHTNLIFNNDFPPYRFANNDGDFMLNVKGSGLISGHGADGIIGGDEIAQISMSGSFNICAGPGEDDLDQDINDRALQFTGVHFSGSAVIELIDIASVSFSNCHFEEGAQIIISGTAGEISFYGCSLDEGSTVDLSDLESDEPEFYSCTGAETGGFILPEYTSEFNWKLPIVALAAVGIGSIVSSSVLIKQKTESKQVEHVARG